MTSHDGLDRRLTAWLDEEAAPRAPQGLSETVTESVAPTATSSGPSYSQASSEYVALATAAPRASMWWPEAIPSAKSPSAWLGLAIPRGPISVARSLTGAVEKSEPS